MLGSDHRLAFLKKQFACQLKKSAATKRFVECGQRFFDSMHRQVAEQQRVCTEWEQYALRSWTGKISETGPTGTTVGAT